MKDVTDSLLKNTAFKYMQFNKKKIEKEAMKDVYGSLDEKEYLGTHVAAKGKL